MKKFLIIGLGLVGFMGLVALAHQISTQNINPDTGPDDPYEQWAWNDVTGWHDWHDSAIHNIEVSGGELRGWASSSVGIVVLNCATTPNDDICNGYEKPFKVNNDGAGNLSGWGWNESVGWISFCGDNTIGSDLVGGRWVCPASPTYQVKIRPSGGQSYFGGSGVPSWAWNDVVGWVSFDCLNTSTCGTSNYKIQTSAGGQSRVAIIDSSVFDTGSAQTVFNSFAWQGSLPAGTLVQFKLATSNDPNGPWDESAYFDIGPLAPDQRRKLSGAQYQSRRYIRYRITLNSDVWQSVSPRIDDVIINWSP